MSQGKVLGLFISNKTKSGRIEQDELVLDEKGIVGDKFYGKNIDRSILITSKHSYEMAKEKSISIDFGYLGENIVLDINPYDLNSGDEIQIADVKLCITENCTICNSLGKVDSSLPKLLAKDRGIFAKTIIGGNIRKGDIVKILKY
jgi:MOSC domain-containing protein YiiM